MTSYNALEAEKILGILFKMWTPDTPKIGGQIISP
jgi:hypothetical protein